LKNFCQTFEDEDDDGCCTMVGRYYDGHDDDTSLVCCQDEVDCTDIVLNHCQSDVLIDCRCCIENFDFHQKSNIWRAYRKTRLGPNLIASSG
jgi:hypothetical protein